MAATKVETWAALTAVQRAEKMAGKTAVPRVETWVD